MHATRTEPSIRALAGLALAGCLLVATGARAEQDRFQADIPAADVARVEAAHRLREGRRGAEAIQGLKPLVASRPDYFSAQYELGLALVDAEEYYDAIGPLEKAAALKRANPAIIDAHVFNTLGLAYMFTGQNDRAEAAFKEAEANEAQLSMDVRRRLYNNLGYLYLNTGRRSEARKYLQIAADQYSSPAAQSNLRSLRALEKRDAQQQQLQLKR